MQNLKEKLLNKVPGAQQISNLNDSNLFSRFSTSLPNSIQVNHNNNKKKDNRVYKNNHFDDDDDDDDLLLACEDGEDSITKSKQSAKIDEFSNERKTNDNKKNEYLKETRFNKSNNFSLLTDNNNKFSNLNSNSNNNNNKNKRENNKNKHKNSLTKNSTTNNENLLVDIGLFADIGETDNNIDLSSSIIRANIKDKHSTKKVDFSNNYNINNKNNYNNQIDNIMDGMQNPNFDSTNDQISVEVCNLNSNELSISNPNESSRDDHCHTLNDLNLNADTKRNVTVWRKLITVLILCVLFMVGEIIGGIIAGSISIQTDAAHMAADIAGFFFSIVAIYVSEKAPTRRMSFGYHRSEVLGALFSTLIIWVLTGVLIYMAVMRIINKDFEIESTAMVVTASCGVLFNIIMYFVLHTNKCFGGVELSHHGHSHSGGKHGHGHGHSHGHNHSHKAPKANGHGHSHSIQSHNHVTTSTNNSNNNSYKMTHLSNNSNKTNLVNSTPDEVVVKVEDCSSHSHSHSHNGSEEEPVTEIDDSSNINLRAAAIHVIGDFIQSVGVLVAALIIYFKPEYRIADPICTFIFSALVILTTAPIMRDIFYVLMEALPTNLNYNAVITDLCLIENVKQAHSLHIWCLTMEKFSLSVHLVTEKDVDSQTIIKEANNLLRKKYRIDRTTIQVEHYDKIMDTCTKCKLPEV